MEIKQNYLMWIGKDGYSKIADWIDEALTRGVSKRVSNAATAKTLTEEGTVVFVAHDEGEYKECHGCLGVIENPERRKAEQEVIRLRNEVKDLEAAKKISANFDKSVDGGFEKAEKDVARCEKLIDSRTAKIKKLSERISETTRWIDGGTGGKVKVKTPGEGTKSWDYRRYNYWLHQPKRFNVEDASDHEMCETCGGVGRLPCGKIFGMFVPQDFEYIVPDGAQEDIVEKMKADGATFVTEAEVKLEPKRGCGKRKAGGVYVITNTAGNPVPTTKAVEQLVEEGKLNPEGVEVHGQFAHFLTPVPIEAKRFRGIKRWGLDPAVEDEAEMIAEAI